MVQRKIWIGFVFITLFLGYLANHRNIVKFIAMRKTLEANMQNANLFPPGRVLWAMRDGDLHPTHQNYCLYPSSGNRLRVFEVTNVEKVFSQIVFARNMLT